MTFAQKYLSEVNERAKYGPIPPPVIVMPTEAGDPDDPLSVPAAILLRRAAPYDLKSPRHRERKIPVLEIPFMLEPLIKEDIPSLTGWIKAYTLQIPNGQLSFQNGLILISKIVEDDAAYPEKLTDWIEKNLLTNLVFDAYWLRYLRPDRIYLENIILDLNLTDLYLVTSNPYEHHAARKLLSYYTDDELDTKFVPLDRSLPRRDRLDILISTSLSRFGYILVENWSYPVGFTYRFSNSERSFSLEELTQMIEQGLDDNYQMAVLRLFIQVRSSWPWISDKKTWETFLIAVRNRLDQLVRVFRSNRNQGRFEIVANIDLREQEFNFCLLCKQRQDENQFGLCGHGVCMNCQAFLGTTKCPFCVEHFVADGINNQYVHTVTERLSVKPALQQRVLEVLSQKRDREYSFDWANSEIKLLK